VVELGAGVGAAGLALAQRIGGLDLTLVEIDPGAAELAQFNAARNGLTARVLVADVGAISALRQAGLADRADAVLMNPPFHDAARHRASPDAARRSAHIADEATLPRWIDAAFRILKARGALTLIWRADALQEVLAALAPRFGSVAVQAVHGRRGKPALRIVVRAVKGGRAPLLLHPSIVIDGADPEVERALRGEGALPMAL
jgi:tRNA1(Val) A37 N6-methylase TrmN6